MNHSFKCLKYYVQNSKFLDEIRDNGNADEMQAYTLRIQDNKHLKIVPHTKKKKVLPYKRENLFSSSGIRYNFHSDLKMGIENFIFRSKTGLGFQDAGRTSSTKNPPPPTQWSGYATATRRLKYNHDVETKTHIREILHFQQLLKMRVMRASNQPTHRKHMGKST